jgi:uncharacterized membrane protein YdjX (TVP38/TMEM64 family)
MTSRDQRSAPAPGNGLHEALRVLVLKSVALVLEFGERLAEREQAHSLAEAAERSVAGRRQRGILKAVAGLLVVVSISAAVLAVPAEWYVSLGAYGHFGVFVITLLTTAAFVLPVPYLAVIFKAGSILNPIEVALVAGVAAALGELTGYLLGYCGRGLLGDSRWHRAVDRWLRRHGFITIAVLAFIPNPAFDAAGIAAGAMRYGALRFVLACFAGKSLKFLAIALAGSQF